MNTSSFAQSPEYLLDTSVFRSLNENNTKVVLNGRSRYKLTASYYAPFELLSGIFQLGSESEIELEYRRRRAALSRYDQLVGINSTYWDDPHTMTLKAFGIQQASGDKTDFQVLIKACIASENTDELNQFIRSAQSYSKNMETLESLQNMDKRLTTSWTSALQTALETERIHSKGHRDIASWRQRLFVILAYQVGVLRTDLTNSRLPLFPDLKSFAVYLGINYDGSLDIYLGAYATYWDMLLRDKNRKPNINDPFDLRHLRYLRVNDNDQILVTSDNGLYNLCQKVTSGRVIKTNEFITRSGN